MENTNLSEFTSSQSADDDAVKTQEENIGDFKLSLSRRIVDNEGEPRRTPVLALLLFWSVMSLITFSFAGERMPWLTSHITMPMILASGWSLGRLVESLNGLEFKRQRWMVLLGSLFLLALFAQSAWHSAPYPFRAGNWRN